MNQRWVWTSVSIALLMLLAVACDAGPAPTPTSALPPPTAVVVNPTAVPTQPAPPPAAVSPSVAAATALPTPPVPPPPPPTGQISQTAPATATVKTAPQPTSGAAKTAAQPASGASPTLVKGALSCPAVVPLAANAQVAARVNGQGIALDQYNRQMTQAQAAFVQQGVDTKSAGGQEAIKSLRQQVLDQMINDVVIAQQAEKEGVKVTDNDVNARLAQMIQDAGSVEKLNEYLAKNQITLTDFCTQIRSNIVGEAMLNRVTVALPTAVEQVHVRQILVATAAQAQQIKKQLDGGADFAALAKQHSLDEASKANGGDLGWNPKGRFDQQFEAVAFQLKVGQVSDVVQTQFGYHLIKVEGHENARELTAELLQYSRQQTFFVWLQAVRQGIKIERFVQ